MNPTKRAHIKLAYKIFGYLVFFVESVSIFPVGSDATNLAYSSSKLDPREVRSDIAQERIRGQGKWSENLSTMYGDGKHSARLNKAGGARTKLTFVAQTYAGSGGEMHLYSLSYERHLYRPMLIRLI